MEIAALLCYSVSYCFGSLSRIVCSTIVIIIVISLEENSFYICMIKCFQMLCLSLLVLYCCGIIEVFCEGEEGTNEFCEFTRVQLA